MTTRHLVALVAGSALLVTSLSAIAQQADGSSTKTPPPATKPAKAATPPAQGDAPAAKPVQRDGKTGQPAAASTRTAPAEVRHDCQGMKDSDA